MLRGQTWRSWGIGLLLGAVVGFMALVGGAPLLALGLAFLALAFAIARGMAFLSGVFLGVGGLWFALAARAQLACDADRTCLGSEGAGQFLALCAVVFGVGLLFGALAWRRGREPQEW